MHITRRNRPKSRFSRGIPNFLGNPPVMTSRSRKYIIISPEKSEKRDVREISLYVIVQYQEEGGGPPS